MWREKIWKEVRWRSLSQEVKKRETFGFLSVFHPLIPSLMILSSTPKSWSLLSRFSLFTSLWYFSASISLAFHPISLLSHVILDIHLLLALISFSESWVRLSVSLSSWLCKKSLIQGRSEEKRRSQNKRRSISWQLSCPLFSLPFTNLSLSLSLSWCPCLFFLVVFLFRTQSVLLFHSFSSSVSFWWNLPQGFSEKVSLLSPVSVPAFKASHPQSH